MAAIIIRETPPSPAPLHIREAWVGCKIPLVSEAELAQNPVSNLRIGNQNKNGYTVSRSKAIEALRALNTTEATEAADYWESWPIGTYLEFKKEVCELVVED